MARTEFKVENICKVINTGFIYTLYDKFALDAGHADIVEKRYLNNENFGMVFEEYVRILHIGVHPNKEEEIVAIVETVDSPSYSKFMIAVAGLEGISRGFMISFVEEYLNGNSLSEKVPNGYVCELLITAIVVKNPMDIQYISPNLLTDENYRSILRKDGGLLGLLPESRRTLALCKLAVREEPYAERFIPENLKSLVKY